MPSALALSYDDVGDPAGRAVVYLHGTPDSRLARHPDDNLAAAAGVRLIAVDRPGYGGTRAGVDLAVALPVLLDRLGIERAALLAWSGGALSALRVAAAAPGRWERLTIVGGLVPAEAYDDPEVRAAAPERLGLFELAEVLDLTDIAAMLAPFPCDLVTAAEHQREQRSPAEQKRLEEIPGAVDRMAQALVEAVRHGLAGVEADLRDQATPLGPAVLARVTLPVRLLYGSDDTVAPPAFGRWYAAHLPDAHLDIVEGAGHYLPFTAAGGTAPLG